MTDDILVGHPFYFPTQVILVDDDPDFLEGISLMLDSHLSYQLFQSATQAQQHVNLAHQHVNFLKRCYSNYKTGPTASDSLSHIDVGKIHNEIFNNNRFQTSSTLIVDYSMPEMNGLEFLASITNPFINKVLLTGQGDMELAVKAFNNQLIDQFIDKHDPKLKQKLNSTIATFEEQYFRNSFKLITDPILANNHDAFLVDSNFQEYFSALRKERDIIEYYLIDEPSEGFLLADISGKMSVLLIYTDAKLNEHIESISQYHPSKTLLKMLKDRKVIPGFNDKDKTLDANSNHLKNWEENYFEATKVGSRTNYYVATIPVKYFPKLSNSHILPYKLFQQAKFDPNEIVH